MYIGTFCFCSGCTYVDCSRDVCYFCFFFFSSRRRHTRLQGDWSSDVCSSDLIGVAELTVKREDRSSARYGGNKVRALEFLLAGAPPGTVFVTLGGTGSTHCLATAVHAVAAAGSAVLAQFPQPETPASLAVAAACRARAALVVRARPRGLPPLAVLGPGRGSRAPRGACSHVAAYRSPLRAPSTSLTGWGRATGIRPRTGRRPRGSRGNTASRSIRPTAQRPSAFS